MNIHFASLNGDWVMALRRLGIQTAHWGDIREVGKAGKTIHVSPANSFGFMDGGIDLLLSRVMFPGIEPKVKARIASLKLQTNLDRPYLPIGSALVVDDCLIVAPTMFLPHDVRTTQNAYWAMKAILQVFQKSGLQSAGYDLVITSLCCGCGNMPPAVSAEQMVRALHEFENGDRLPDASSDPTVVLLPSRNAEQPRIFDNREIQDECAN